MSRFSRLLSAGALVAVSAAFGPAHATADPGLPGESVEPGESALSGTELDSGLYRVAAPEPAKSQFFTVPRTIPGSTIWIGVTGIFPEAVTGPLVVQTYAEGDSDRECTPKDRFLDDTGQLYTMLFPTGGPCAEADSVSIETSVLLDDDPPTQDYQLVVWEEPPVQEADLATLPDPNPAPAWVPPPPATEPEALTVASSHAEAPTLENGGTYRFTVAAGGLAVFRVPLTWGEHLQAVVTSPTSPQSSLSVEPSLLTPLGGIITPENVAPADIRYADPVPGEPTVIGWWSAPVVSWKSRNTDREHTPPAIAGDYFLAIAIRDDDPEIPKEIELTMQVQIVADYPGRQPEYTEPAPPLPVIDGSVEDKPAGGDSDGPSPLLVTGLFAAAAVAAGAGGVALRRGLRR